MKISTAKAREWIEYAVTEALGAIPIDEGLEVLLDPSLNQGLENYEVVTEAQKNNRNEEECGGIIFEDEDVEELNPSEEQVLDSGLSENGAYWMNECEEGDKVNLEKTMQSENQNNSCKESRRPMKAESSQDHLGGTEFDSKNAIRVDSDEELEMFSELERYVQLRLKEDCIENIFNQKIKVSSWYHVLQKFTSKFIKEKISKNEEKGMEEIVSELASHFLKKIPKDIFDFFKEETNKILEEGDFLGKIRSDNFLESLIKKDESKIRTLAMGKIVKEIQKDTCPTLVDSEVQVDFGSSKNSLGIQTDEGFESSSSVYNSPAKRCRDNSTTSEDTSSNNLNNSPKEQPQNPSSDCAFDKDFVIKELDLAVLQNKVKMGILTFLSRSKNYDINFNIITFIYSKQEYARISWMDKQNDQKRVYFFVITLQESPYVQEFLENQKSKKPNKKSKNSSEEEERIWNYSTSKMKELKKKPLPSILRQKRRIAYDIEGLVMKKLNRT